MNMMYRYFCAWDQLVCKESRERLHFCMIPLTLPFMLAGVCSALHLLLSVEEPHETHPSALGVLNIYFGKDMLSALTLVALVSFRVMLAGS